MSEKVEGSVPLPRLYGRRNELATIELEQVLSPGTLAVRRTLLGTAWAASVAALTGLTPKTVLGVEFEPYSRTVIMFVLVATLCYLIAMFFIRGFIDFRVWVRKLDKAYCDHHEQLAEEQANPSFFHVESELKKDERRALYLERFLNWWLPILVGIAALILCVIAGIGFL